MKKKEIRLRCWIAIDGVKFFGPGPRELLTLIDECGSISKAAKSMGMSYKKAWAMVEDLNARGSKPYVITRKGGQKGGGTMVTDNGKKAIAAYERLMTKLSSIVDKESEMLKLV